MEIVNNKYYTGFEGEPEIQLICKNKEEIHKIIIWEGFFDEIMKAIVPEEHGWTGLAYYYNMNLGWYEEGPWIIDDLQMAIWQLNTLDCKSLSSEACEILKLICNMFKEAIDNGLDVCIIRE